MEIDDLPAEVLVKVLGYVLDPAQLSRLAQVSHRWKSLRRRTPSGASCSRGGGPEMKSST
jgi:hypothetical protein